MVLQVNYAGKIVVIAIDNPHYPRLLREIPDPPAVLYVRGTGSKINLNKTLAVVGTRHVTTYGREITKKLVADLVARGYTIVSGLAYGVDAVAHEAAIDAGGKTIAVLGCGIDIIAPPVNTDLYWRIVRGYGAIVSEVPPGVRMDKRVFAVPGPVTSKYSGAASFLLKNGAKLVESADDIGEELNIL